MKVIELKYKNRIFLVPAVPFTPILTYQRYGYYYTDLQGWEVTSEYNINHIKKQNFYLNIAEEDILELEVKNINQSTNKRLMDNKIQASGTFPFSDKDWKQMLDKFYTLEKFLKQEGLID